jgi:hypothetical protein
LRRAFEEELERKASDNSQQLEALGKLRKQPDI